MLSETQKASIRLYLGYPDNFRWQNTRLESVLENLSTDAESLVGGMLANIATIETTLLSDGISGAGVKRVDEIWFENGWKRTSELRKLGRMYVSRISIVTGVPIYSDVFGTQGYLGDSFSGPGNNSPTGFFNLG